MFDSSRIRLFDRLYFPLLALLLLAVAYVTLAVSLSRLGAFWSPDCGARFAMIRNWVEHGSLIHWYYPSRDVDPTGEIHPLAYFLFHLPQSYCAMYEPLFPLLCGFMYRAFGFGGLIIIPVLSGLGTATVTYATAWRLRLRSSTLIPLVIGLGTPLVIYSVVFWDHVVMMLLTAIAGYLLLRGLQEDRARSSAWAGAALGLGIWIHELMLALFLSVLVTSLPLVWHRRSRRLVLGLVAGFTPLALLWAAANWIIYGNVGGPHMSANMGGNATDHPFSLSLILDYHQLAERWLEELAGTMSSGIMIVNSHTALLPYFLVFISLLIAYVIITWLGSGALRRFSPLLSLTAAILACYLVLQVHWANGLFQATPLFIPALAIPWIAGRGLGETIKSEQTDAQELPPVSIFYAWMSRASWLYIILILINPMLPGVDWGSRYLLTVLPLLVLLTVHALEEQYQEARPKWRPLVVGSAVALFGISTICQSEGLVMIRRNILYNQEVNRRAHALMSPVIVFSNIGLGPELTAASLPHLQFMVRTDEDVQRFTRALWKRKADSFTYIGNPVGLEPFLNAMNSTFSDETTSIVITESLTFHVDRSREDGEDLQFVSFAFQTNDLRSTTVKKQTMSEGRTL